MNPLSKLKDPSLLHRLVFFRGQSSIKNMYTVTDPGSGFNLRTIPACSAAEADAAISSAHVAFVQSTSSLSPASRSKILQRWHSLVLENLHDLAAICSAECGKPLHESTGEIKYAASFIEFFGEEAKRLDGSVIASDIADRRILTLREPLGVCVLITPWNFPVAMVTRKIAPAFAAGNSVVLKPAPETPLSALALAHLAIKAGFPENSFQVLPTTRELAPDLSKRLIEHPETRKVSITGSTQAGKAVMQYASHGVKRVSMELGGNAPFILFPFTSSGASTRESYVAHAVKELVKAKFRNAGQTCISPNRIFVHKSLKSVFVEELLNQIKPWRYQYAFESDVEDNRNTIGPLISDASVERVQNLLEDAQTKGATLLTGGKFNHRFLEPTVLDNCSAQMRIFKEEIFAPVIPIYSFEETNQVLALANDTNVGLAGYFFSNDYQLVWNISRKLNVGMIGINETAISTEVAPFGGIKESGFGREGSKIGLDDYSNIKYVCMGGLSAS